MTDRKRPQRDRDPRNIVIEVTPGLWAELTPYEVDVVIDGVEVHAELDWDFDRKVPFIDRLEISRANGQIDPSVLRSITMPALVAAGQTSARFWFDESCTEPFDENRLPGETLEQWAARLFCTCTITQRSPAEYIADVQGITVGSASQRLTMCRKMGLIGTSEKKRV